jgi:hypothetical protein
LLPNQLPEVFRSVLENNTNYALNAKQPKFGAWRIALQRVYYQNRKITFQE